MTLDSETTTVLNPHSSPPSSQSQPHLSPLHTLAHYKTLPTHDTATAAPARELTLPHRGSDQNTPPLYNKEGGRRAAAVYLRRLSGAVEYLRPRDVITCKNYRQPKSLSNRSLPSARRNSARRADFELTDGRMESHERWASEFCRVRARPNRDSGRK